MSNYNIDYGLLHSLILELNFECERPEHTMLKIHLDGYFMVIYDSDIDNSLTGITIVDCDTNESIFISKFKYSTVSEDTIIKMVKLYSRIYQP